MLDAIDVKILSILQKFGRRHLAEIAKEVELSPPAVMERVKKLESRHIIRGYHAFLDAKKIGRDITAFIGVSINHQRYIDDFSSCMAAQEDVLECHLVTGDESFILKVKTRSTLSLERLLAEIRSMEGVTATITKVVLSTCKEGHVLGFGTELSKTTAGDKEVQNSDAGKEITSGMRNR
ncbi:MAG: Lrp/AsnC family transcriptional regulator [Candidatus Binatia bacterium]